MRKLGLALVLAGSAFLVACGGGGGGGSPASAPTASTPTQSCVSTQTVSGTTLCLNYVLVDGVQSAMNFYYGASASLASSSSKDIVILQSGANAVDPAVASNNLPAIFLKGTSNPLSFTSWSPTITGGDGKANAFYGRDLIFGDFGNGNTSMYIADENEWCGTGIIAPCNLLGVTQYVYINDGAGNFTKKDVGIGLAGVHGESGGNFSTDKFSVVFNNPWAASNPTKIATGLNLTTATPTVTASTLSAPMLNSNGACFYTATVMLKNVKSAGGINSNQRDVICFSPSSGTLGWHTIAYNDGNGDFNVTAPDNLANAPGFNGWTVEDVTVGNFSGHTDGREDFAVVEVNRSGSGTANNTAIRIYITDANGVPSDQTATYFGASCTQCATEFANDSAKFHRIHALDINNDGKADLVTIRDPAQNGSRQIEVLVNQGASFSRKTFVPPTGTYIGSSDLIAVKTANGVELIMSITGKLTAVTVQ
jgi:hypothetical protein